ncbi:MAG: cell envelope biogenesis protein OmpA [Desulfobacterales bacterium]|nr:cell envelope biogenesis protein OmpA [Desulfobacterales bacterium]
MSPYRTTLYILIVMIFLMMVACAQKRPVLYPNYHLQQVGQSVAQADIDDCIQKARNYGAQEKTGERIAKKTAEGAAVGGAAGGAAGAVAGRSGRSAAAGAAGAGAGTLTREVIRSGDPDPIFRRFVEKCLQKKGYETIGWR